jgi:hypothetical protein
LGAGHHDVLATLHSPLEVPRFAAAQSGVGL